MIGLRSMCRVLRLPARSAVLAGTLLLAGSALGQAASPKPDSPVRFGEVGDFHFIERSGKEITKADLLGSPWIAVPFFRGCTGPCPSLTSDLHAAFRERLAGSGVRIVSFTLDAEKDTPEALREYAESYGIEGDQWLFLTGPDKQALQDFVRTQLRVPVAESPEAAQDYGQAITHGTRLPVIDPQGRIAGWYECARATFGDTEAFQASIDALTARALALGGRHQSPLPLINAVLNAVALILLLLGLGAIAGGHRERHAHLMGSAFLVSLAFLGSYLYYHLVVQAETGPVHFHAEGAAKVAYLVLLATHVVGAMVNLPMVLRTLYLARKEDWGRHKWWARRTLPLWLYVSITGVMVYLLLYPLNPTPPMP